MVPAQVNENESSLKVKMHSFLSPWCKGPLKWWGLGWKCAKKSSPVCSYLESRSFIFICICTKNLNQTTYFRFPITHCLKILNFPQNGGFVISEISLQKWLLRHNIYTFPWKKVFNFSKWQIFSKSLLFLSEQRFCKYQLILWPDLKNYFSSESSLDKDANRCK